MIRRDPVVGEGANTSPLPSQISEVEQSSISVVDTGGVTVLRWRQQGGHAEGRAASVLSHGDPLLAWNVAYHPTQATFAKHEVKMSVVVNLATGATLSTVLEDNEKKVKAHAVLQVLVWAYLAPLAILIKRFGPMACKPVGKYPLPFVLHAGMMFVSIVLTVASTGLALNKFDGGTKHGHRGLGVVVMVCTLVQMLMQVSKCEHDDPKRAYFRGAHALLGMATYAMATAQLFTGARNYNRLYEEDFAKRVRVASGVGLGLFVAAFLLLTAAAGMYGKASEPPQRGVGATEVEAEAGAGQELGQASEEAKAEENEEQ